MMIARTLANTFGAIVIPDNEPRPPDPREVMSLLSTTPVILLRGYSFTQESFLAFSNEAGGHFSTYLGGALRFRSLDRKSLDTTGTLLSTTGGSHSFAIPLHGEMYYQRSKPDLLWFFCKRPPVADGQTTVADARSLFLALSERSKAVLRTTNLRFTRCLGPLDWPLMFQTDDIGQLAKLCAVEGANLSIRPDHSVEITYACSPLVVTSDASELFLNSLMAIWTYERDLGNSAALVGSVDTLSGISPLNVRFEDGSPVPSWLIQDIEEASEATTIDINWSEGDVLLLDNRRALHGRRAGGGATRAILVRMMTLDTA